MNKNRKQKFPRIRVPFVTVVGEPSILFEFELRRKNTAQRNARKLRQKPTPAEKKFEDFLNELNSGVLRGKFLTQWAFADKWILDFFFFENRLGIEIDGSVHSTQSQKDRDRAKELSCDKYDITLIRIPNNEVYGSQENLIRKLREGWDTANRRVKGSPFYKEW